MAEELFEELLSIIEEKKLDEMKINKAFEKANELHKDQFRKGGQPYIVHPIAVAIILAKLDFNENVICAGLLHDTIEDCEYTDEEMISEFGKTIFNLVDCVSAIEKTHYVFDENDIFEDINFEKSSMEEQTFKKLISIGKKNPYGFAIKFADRLHNLRTISVFDYNKQLEKVKQTEKWIIPIAKILKSEYFYRALKNECFKITNKGNVDRFLNEYMHYHESNKENLDNILNYLKVSFLNVCSNIKIKDIREYKVFEDIVKINKNIDLQKVTQSQMLKVPNYNIYLLYEGLNQKEMIQKAVTIISKSTKLRIIDSRIGGFTDKLLFILEDEIRNKYALYIMKEDDYYKQRNGTLDVQMTQILDDENINDLEQGIIKVETVSGEFKFIPKNSTALDFAFKIHKDIGLGFKYAIINGTKTKQPPFAKLYDKDKVEIIVDRSEDDKIIKKVELKWLAYVNTELAKKRLIKYFEKELYEKRK